MKEAMQSKAKDVPPPPPPPPKKTVRRPENVRFWLQSVFVLWLEDEYFI